jgi:ribosomal protein L11 methyltransferase
VLNRVSVRFPAEEAEIGRARILALVPEGFEERDVDGGLELTVYVDPAVETALRSAFGEVASTPVEPGWGHRWRRFHRAVRVGGLWIGPPWETPPADEPTVVVDPGRAFGTGAHPTTQLCVELLARTTRREGLLDVGCGSGVLAVAAARLGFDPVRAVDVDEAAVEVARVTARANGVQVRIARADALRERLPDAETVLANIELRAVERLLARIEAVQVVTSGYLAHEQPRVLGWRSVDRLELEGWAADAFEPSKPGALRAAALS